MTATTTANTATGTAAAELLAQLPQLCGPLGDLNRDQACTRAAKLWSITRWTQDVLEDDARLGRLRSPRRIAGLTSYLATVGVERLELVRELAAKLPACTHPAELQQELSLEDALPACSC